MDILKTGTQLKKMTNFETFNVLFCGSSLGPSGATDNYSDLWLAT